ncbi:hypothetical protein VSU19_16640 [Verrucomicrobiales bacterium BCK34]|nr:hypothetical protein [Verrucomicrobiales bacterium BCK34]
MTDRDLELIRDYLDDRISPANLAGLNHLLENDSEARTRFRALATMEEGLRDLAELPTISQSNPLEPSTQPSSVEAPTLSKRKVTPIVPGLFARPLFAAAAGLIIGVFCTSAVWAASESGRRTILTLLHESFESGPAPLVTGVPRELELWSGDFTSVVGEADGLLPVHGEKMLQFQRADHANKEKPVGYVSDLYRILDMRSFESAVIEDDAVVSVEAGFRSIPFQDPNRYQCGISIYALREIPTDPADWKDLFETSDKLMEDSLATAQRWIFLNGNSADWQRGRTELRVPSETRFLVLGIRVSDRNAIQANGEEPPAVEFSGQFVDDIRVTLRRAASDL